MTIHSAVLMLKGPKRELYGSSFMLRVFLWLHRRTIGVALPCAPCSVTRRSALFLFGVAPWPNAHFALDLMCPDIANRRADLTSSLPLLSA